MSTITKSIPNNAKCESTGNFAIPDAINIDNIDIIHRSVVELNHRARLGMEVIVPSGMKQAVEGFYADLARLHARSNGLRVVNDIGVDSVAEKAALERQKRTADNKQFYKELAAKLSAFGDTLEKYLALTGAKPSAPLKSRVAVPPKATTTTRTFTTADEHHLPSKPAGKKSAAKRSA